MKTTFKLSGLSFNMTQAQLVVEECKVNDKTVSKVESPARTGEFGISEIEVVQEYDVAELPAIVNIVMPMLEKVFTRAVEAGQVIGLAKVAAVAAAPTKEAAKDIRDRMEKV